MSESRHGDFAKGEDDPEAYPDDKSVGRFSEGQEELSDEDHEKRHRGLFSEGQDEVDAEDLPEGSYAETDE